MEIPSSPGMAATHPPATKTIKHDIFLSHSGKQKGFAKDLATRLSCEGYTVFFDQNIDSLPPGEDFPSHIFSALETCKLAIVLLCEGFITSRWPLTELCSFVDRRDSARNFTILPLFFKLSPADLKVQENIRKWQVQWERLERGNNRISVAKCENAVTKVLPRLSGVCRHLESEQGEGSYIDAIMERIYDILPRRILSLHRYGASPNKRYFGMERLCQIILDKFRELEDPNSTSESEVNFANCCILGMYGVSGSGKSTLCNTFCNSMVDEFMGKVIYLELPTEFRGDDDPRIVKQYLKLLSTISSIRRDTLASMDVGELYNLLLAIGSRFIHKMFLVLDNISKSNNESYKKLVKAILLSGVLGSGSRVMLIAQSSALLKHLLEEVSDGYRYTITEVPSLTREEAMDVIRDNYPSSVKEDVIPPLLDKCSFPSSSFMFVPFVFEQIGILLKKNWTDRSDLKELEQLLKMVDECKKEAVQKLVEINFERLSKDLRILFFDIALFMIPAGYSKLSDATPILCLMHDMSDPFTLKRKIKNLMEHCALSETDDGELRVHDIYVEYARSIPGNSKSYVDELFFNISDAPAMFHIRLLQLEYRDARTICLYSHDGHHENDDVCFHEDERAKYCRALALEIALHVEVGARTRGLFVRNSRKYCNCILALSGDLSSLVCLRTENVQLEQNSLLSPAGSDSPLSNLVRVEIRNANVEDFP